MQVFVTFNTVYRSSFCLAKVNIEQKLIQSRNSWGRQYSCGFPVFSVAVFLMVWKISPINVCTEMVEQSFSDVNTSNSNEQNLNI